MSGFNLTRDKSWVIVFALLFIVPPIGFVALIAKIFYGVYVNQKESESTPYRPRGTTMTSNSMDNRDKTPYNYKDELEDIEADLKEAFDKWQDKESDEKIKRAPLEVNQFGQVTPQPSPVEIHMGDAAFSEVSDGADPAPNLGEEVKEQSYKVEEIESDDLVLGDRLSTTHLETHLNTSTEALDIKEGVMVDTDVDLTFSDVHIDTEITFDDEPEDHHHEGEEPLKVISCTMCGTENRIYKIDKFETPTCEKCGMLLLDR